MRFSNNNINNQIGFPQIISDLKVKVAYDLQLLPLPHIEVIVSEDISHTLVVYVYLTQL